eukprot:3771099-Rhodomonas_salina.2
MDFHRTLLWLRCSTALRGSSATVLRARYALPGAKRSGFANRKWTNGRIARRAFSTSTAQVTYLCSAMVLWSCYDVSGTDVAYRGTRKCTSY